MKKLFLILSVLSCFVLLLVAAAACGKTSSKTNEKDVHKPTVIPEIHEQLCPEFPENFERPRCPYCPQYHRDGKAKRLPHIRLYEEDEQNSCVPLPYEEPIDEDFSQGDWND